jgi:SAM-dependent methyltransferase
MQLINPWDLVYKEQGEVFSEPYSGFSSYLELIKSNKTIRNVLDLGCGTGRHALPLIKAGFDVYAFDISENAVKFLENAASELLAEDKKLDLKIADMFEKFPYPDGFFDSVISIAVVYHGTLNNITSAFEEVSRVMRKGGILYFTASVSIEHSKRVNSGNNYIMVEKGTYLPLDGREKYLVHHYFTKDELFSLLRKNFKDITVEFDGDNYYEVYATKR